MAGLFASSITSLFGKAADMPAWEKDRATFFKALAKDDVATVTATIEKYPNECIKWETKKGTALGVALKNGAINSFRTLLDAGADPNEGRYRENGILVDAVKRGRQDFVLALLDKKGVNADVDIVSVNGYGRRGEKYVTPLVQAVQCKDKSMIRLLLERGANATMEPYPESPSALQTAMSGKLFEIADILKGGKTLRENYLKAQQDKVKAATAPVPPPALAAPSQQADDKTVLKPLRIVLNVPQNNKT